MAPKNKNTFSVGGVIGFAENDVINCSATGKISLKFKEECTSQDKINIGGLIGIYQYTGSGSNNVKFLNSHSNVFIEADSMITCGGFLGNASEENSVITIEKCYAKGDMNLKSSSRYVGFAGGFIGSFSMGKGSSIKDCYSTGNILADSANGFAYNLLGYSLLLDVTNCFSKGSVNGYTDSNGFACSVSANMFNCYSNSNVDSISYATGFIDSFSGTMKRCFSTGDIKGATDITGFIWYANGDIEECYRSGNIKAGRFGCGFIFVGDYNLYNCYSTSNITMFSKEVLGVYGFVGITGGYIMNCYYSGAIIFEIQPNYENLYLALFASEIEGDIINCHVFSSDNLLKAIEKERGTNTITDLTSYVYVTEMFQLADKLNKDCEKWVNTTDENLIPNATPKFKDL